MRQAGHAGDAGHGEYRQVFLPVKYNFISAGNTAVDSQLIETRLFSLQEIARYFNISPILLGDLSKGNVSSVEDAQILFLSNCLLPLINLIEQELDDILESVSFVDKIIFGRTNYSKEVSAYKEHKEFYNKAAEQITAYCNGHGIAYHIKDGTITEPTKKV